MDGDQIIELTSLIETAQILNSSLDYKFILNHIMLATMGKVGISKSALAVDPSLFSGGGAYIKLEKGILLEDSLLSELFKLDLEGSADVTYLHNPIRDKIIAASASRVFAIRTSQHLLGYLVIGEKRIWASEPDNSAREVSSDRKLAPTEIEFVSTLCNIAAAAIENASVFQRYKDSNSELQQRVQELQTLFELSKEFNLLLDEARAVRTLEFAVMGQTGARKFAICLMRNSKPQIVVNRIPGIERIDFAAEPFVESLCAAGQPARLADVVEELPSVKALIETGAEVMVPFQLQGEAHGLLILGERMSHAYYSDSEINFLSSLCNLAAMAIDNARLFEESLAMQRLEEELNLAHTIQEKLLPREMPVFPGCELKAYHVPTKQVGGDYFDLIKIDPDTLCLAIADVSGKGFPAALLMANLQSAFHALIGTGMRLVEVCERLNEIVYENTDFDKFITFFTAIYNSTDKTLKYVNAGHNYPFLVGNDGKIVRLDKGGLMLGVMENVRFEVGSERIKSGDLLYMFTDGVNEAMNTKDEQFTEERLEKLLSQNANLTAEGLLDLIRSQVSAFVGDAAQSDDITQLCAKFL